MALDYQVTVDARDPHRLARFWADALGFEVQDYTEMIRSLLDQGVAREDDVVEFEGMLLWRVGAAIIDPPTGRRILFMRVEGPTPGKNKWHLDLNVGRDNIDAEVARLTTLGATERYQVDEPGAFHTTMADPEGNLFCVQ
jgi:catechol 2,3-dioxygenase-like lactoylglutathione lyase family enzyme